ncbi:MAG: septum formation initiator family protein [Lachnospiraceae bacterium]|nr:septum formation initiator family protein [Lachnospiraceae bacterium]
MGKARAKTKKQKSFTSIMVFCFMLIFITAVCANLVAQSRNLYALKAEETILAQKIDDANTENIQLKNQQEYYTSDVYIEKIAREQLGLIMPDEMVFKNRSE